MRSVLHCVAAQQHDALPQPSQHFHKYQACYGADGSWPLQVKDNFERFISCKSTIDDIHVRLRKAEMDYGDGADGASTADMIAAVTDVSPVSLPLYA